MWNTFIIKEICLTILKLEEVLIWNCSFVNFIEIKIICKYAIKINECIQNWYE